MLGPDEAAKPYDGLRIGCPPAVVMQDADYNIVDTELVAFFTTTTNLTNGMYAACVWCACKRSTHKAKLPGATLHRDTGRGAPHSRDDQ
jgi:hypothetical protein